MITARGFTSLAFILAIVIGLAILGGAAYYITLPDHSPAPQPTSDSAAQTGHPADITNTVSAPAHGTILDNSASTAPTASGEPDTTAKPSATIDQNSLKSTSRNPTIAITNVSGNIITVQYANLTNTIEGDISPKSLSAWVQSDNFSKPILKVSLNGAPSGAITVTLPAAAPDGDYTITPVGLPVKSYVGGVGPGWVSFGVYATFSVLNGSVHNYSATQ